MAVSIGIPTDKSEIIIDNFEVSFVQTCQKLFVDLPENFRLPKVLSKNYNMDTLKIENNSSISFEGQDCCTTIFYDDQTSEYCFQGMLVCSNWFSMDIGGSRSPVGILMLTVLAVMLAERSKGVIEDPSKFWMRQEISSVEQFIEQIKIPMDRSMENDIVGLALEFYTNLNSHH